MLSDFPACPVVKNPLVNAGAMGSIPGPEGFHMPWGSWARVPQLLKPPCPFPWSATGAATMMRGPHAAARERPLITATRESREDLAQPKKNIICFFENLTSELDCYVYKWHRTTVICF